MHLWMSDKSLTAFAMDLYGSVYSTAASTKAIIDHRVYPTTMLMNDGCTLT